MNNFFKSLFLALSFCLLFNSSAMAGVVEAKLFVDNLGKQTIDIVSNKNFTETAKREKLEHLFTSNVNLNWIGKFVLGKHWREASEAQRTRYLKNYQVFIVRSYTDRFMQYAGEKFKILNAKEDGPGNYLLTMEIQRQQDANVLVDYKIREEVGVASNKKYQIYDLVVEGVSMIATQRSEFSSVVTRNGLDYLIDRLEKKPVLAKTPVRAS